MPINVVIGLQRGDEGKGRFVDMLATDHDIVARYNGGPNAGHTIAFNDGTSLALHTVPSGITRPGIMNVIGNSTLIDPLKLNQEINNIQSNGFEVSRNNLKISSAAHLILPHHIYDDHIRELGDRAQGSTKSGIAYVASHKAMRVGARVEIIKNDPESLLNLIHDSLLEQREARYLAGIDQINEWNEARDYVESIKKIGQYVTDTVYFLNQQLAKDKPARVLAEGAQAFLLDIDHGMYPFTSSSSTTTGGVCTGLGVAPSYIENVMGIVKAVQSHVGGGPFVTEIKDYNLLKQLHGDMTTIDAEKGTTTGRQRRLGYLDLPQIRRSVMINGVSSLALTKLDWLPRFGSEIKVCTSYQRKDKSLTIAPDAAYKLEQSQPVYETLPLWEEDIQQVRHFADLPSKAQQFVNFLEKEIGISIDLIGVGPKRDQVIEKNNN